MKPKDQDHGSSHYQTIGRKLRGARVSRRATGTAKRERVSPGTETRTNKAEGPGERRTSKDQPNGIFHAGGQRTSRELQIGIFRGRRAHNFGDQHYGHTVTTRRKDWTTHSTHQEDQQTSSKGKQEKPLKEQVPQELHDYLLVFDKKTAERFPKLRPWDHAIDLKPDFVPRDCKVYPLSLPEQQELETFIKDNLAKGYI